MIIKSFVIYIILVVFYCFLYYFNNSLESVQRYHYKLLDYDWNKDQMYLKYCCLASVIRVNIGLLPLLEKSHGIYNIKLLKGYNNQMNPEIMGISFTNDDKIFLIFISTSNLDDVKYSLENNQIRLKHGMIHSGYYSRVNNGLYTSTMENLINYNTKKDIVLIGHSLGGTMASIIGLQLNEDFGFNCRVYTYGSPKWGNCQINKYVRNSKTLQITNYINTSDPVVDRPKSVKYTRIGLTKSFKIDTGNDNVNHGIKVYREIVIQNNYHNISRRNHRLDEIISRSIMDLVS